MSEIKPKWQPVKRKCVGCDREFAWFDERCSPTVLEPGTDPVDLCDACLGELTGETLPEARKRLGI